MFFKRGFVALVMLSLLAACSLDDCGAIQTARAVGSFKSVRDTRTGLCFVFTAERGGSRYGLSSVSCETVQHVLGRNSAAGERVLSGLQYSWVARDDRQLCFATVEDDAGNLRSNLAVVPCESVRLAAEQADLPFTQYFP